MIWPFKKKSIEPNIELPSYWPAARAKGWPIFIDGRVPVSCWTHPDGKDRVFLIRRLDGAYTYKQEHFYQQNELEFWRSVNPGTSIFDSEETAISELKVLFRWIIDVKPEKLFG